APGDRLPDLGRRHGPRSPPRRRAGEGAHRLSARESPLPRPPDGGAAPAPLRSPVRSQGRGALAADRDAAAARAHGGVALRARAQVLQGDDAAPGHGPGDPQRAGPADSGRADRRSRPDRKTGDPRPPAGAEAEGGDDLPELAPALGGGAAVRPGGDPEGGGPPARGAGLGPDPPPERLADRSASRRAGDPGAGRVERPRPAADR